jgi:predicted metalloprotease with PDZ domain
LSVKNDGAVGDVIPDEAADRAGIAPSMKIVAVNGRRFSTDVLRAAIAATGESDGRLELLVENADYFQTYTLDYHGGEKYPRLQRDDSKPDLLAEIIKPLTGQESAASQPTTKPGPP